MNTSKQWMKRERMKGERYSLTCTERQEGHEYIVKTG